MVQGKTVMKITCMNEIIIYFLVLNKKAWQEDELNSSILVSILKVDRIGICISFIYCNYIKFNDSVVYII